MLQLLCKPSFKINSSTPSQMKPDKGYNQSTFQDIIFHTFAWYTLITITMVDDNKILFDQPMASINWPSTSKSKRTVNHLWPKNVSPSALKQWFTQASNMWLPLVSSTKFIKSGKYTLMENTLCPSGRHTGPKNSLTIMKCDKWLVLHTPSLVSTQQQ